MVFHSLRLKAAALIITSLSVLPFGQTPRRDFRAADFSHLRWIEGTWIGSGGGVSGFYERYHFINDSTLESASFTDAELKHMSTRSVFALRNGRIYDESGKNRWEAARINAGTAQFVPVRGATNSFQFTRISKDHWTATVIPATGKRLVYEMRRV